MRAGIWFYSLLYFIILMAAVALAHRTALAHNRHSIKLFWDFPGDPVPKTPSTGGLGSILPQGTRSHMLQLRVYLLQLKRFCMLQLRPGTAR